MNLFRSILFLLLSLLTQFGCERHSAVETVPGYAEKLAQTLEEQKKQATTPETIHLTPPKFFPSGEQGVHEGSPGNH